MTEEDLLQLDFTRVVDDDNGPSYHYYTYDVGSLCLISQANDKVKNDEWYVELFESNTIRFTSRTELEIFMTLLINNYRDDKDKNNEILSR